MASPLPPVGGLPSGLFFALQRRILVGVLGNLSCVLFSRLVLLGHIYHGTPNT